MNEREDRRRHTRCSFCGKDQSQVRKLVAGPGVYICDQCIDLCTEILQADATGGPPPAPSQRTTPDLGRWLARAREGLAQVLRRGWPVMRLARRPAKP